MADLTSPLNPGERGPKSQPLTATAGSEPTALYVTTPFVPNTGSAEERTVVQQLADFVERHAKGGVPMARGYRLIQPLGEGTFGAVWLAEDRAGVRVAIKFFAHGTGREWKQLQDEVRSLAQLETTAGIIPLKEVQPESNPPYFVMAFAEGGSLAQLLEAGRLPLKTAVRYFRHIAEALAFVHEKGIRHCDLKPGNILLNQHGRPLIADFGQAHMSDDATPSLGTFFYMAPEQAELDASIPDTRWDVYSLGALFYAMLTGEPPRRDSSLSDELKKTESLHHRLKLYRERIRAMPLPTAHRRVPGIDRMLIEIIDHCLALDPAKRLRDAGAVLAALETRKRQRRQRPLLALAAVFSIAALGTLAGAGAWLARAATADAADSLRQQQLRSNKVTANLAANVLKERLLDRIEFLENTLKQAPNVARLIESGAKARRESVGKSEFAPGDLQPLRAWLLNEYQQRAEQYFRGLTAIDKDGYVLARAGKQPTGGVGVAPVSADERREKYDRSYSWRNWFNGDRDFYEAQDAPRPMITSPFISQPYVGKYFNSGQTLINIAIPARLDGQLVGLLMGNIEWDEFQRWLTEVPFAGGFAVIVNGLGQCLCHQASTAVRPIAGESATRFYADSPIPRDQPKELRDFVDPVTGKTYLAGGAPFRPLKERDDRWAVLILHEPDGVLAPVTQLQERLHRVGIWCLSIMAVMIGGMFGGLIWMLRREERLAHG